MVFPETENGETLLKLTNTYFSLITEKSVFCTLFKDKGWFLLNVVSEVPGIWGQQI